MKDEIFKERKPGLSSFADRVEHAEDQIDQLLQIADKEVSRFKHRSTPLVLRATAGLRLVSETKQKASLARRGEDLPKVRLLSSETGYRHHE